MPEIGSVTNELTTPDGLAGFPANVVTNGGVRFFSREVRAADESASSYSSDYITIDSSGYIIQFGQIWLRPDSLPDLNQNGVPDIYDSGAAVTVSFSGSLEVDWPVMMFWTLSGGAARQAGAREGAVTLNFKTGGNIVSYSGPFFTVTMDGSLNYQHHVFPPPLCSDRGISLISALQGSTVGIRLPLENQAMLSVLYRIGDRQENLSARALFRIINPDQLSFDGGMFSDTMAANPYYFDPFVLRRTNGAYSGILRLRDGDLTTPWADYSLYSVSITDTNDYNSDGIPDMSDPPPKAVSYEWGGMGVNATTSSIPVFTLTSSSTIGEMNLVATGRTMTNAEMAPIAHLVRNEFLWATNFTTPGVEYPTALAVTTERHLFVAAAVQAPPMQENGSAIGQNGMLTEYDRNGDARMVLALASPAFAIPHALALRADGNLTLAGEYADGLYCGTRYIAPNGFTNGFVVCCAPDGSIIWLRSLTKATAHAIARDTNDNLYIAGVAEGGAMFGPLPVDTHGLFLGKFNSAGDAAWVRSSAMPELAIGDVAVDSGGNVLVTGAAYLDDGLGFSKQIFLSKYSAVGDLIWNHQAGGNGNDRAVKIAPAASGEIYLAVATPSSWFRFESADVADFEQGAAAGVLRIDAAGKLVWARFVKCSLPTMGAPLNVVLRPGQGPLLIAFATQGEVQCGDVSVLASAWEGGYAAQFDFAGTLRFIETIPVPPPNTAAAMTSDEYGEMALSFGFSNPLEFGGFKFTPQMSDVLTVYIGRPLALRARATGSNLTLLWPRSWPDAWLEMNSDLNRPYWNSITRGSAASDFDFLYNTQMAEPAVFYKLEPPKQ